MTSRGAAQDRWRTGWARTVATVCGLGERLPAPGTTAGSFPAALVWAALWMAAPSWLTWVATAAVVVTVTVAGIWAAGTHAREIDVEDPGAVVVDEVAGQWVTFLVALPFITGSGWRFGLLVVATGFLLFRAFDVIKPWPLRELEKLPGGFGIVADDIAAGVYAGAGLALAARSLL